jgi:oligogalacturonide lyase
VKKKSWGVEWITYKDRETGATVRQLSNYLGHHYHLYFTNPGWWDNGKKMLMGGDRNNATNLFSIDLVSGEITQLTDYERCSNQRGPQFLTTSVNPQYSEAYYYHPKKLWAIDLNTCEQRPLYEPPEGYNVNSFNATCDGKYVVGNCIQDLSDKIKIDMEHGYAGVDEINKARPHCFIFKVPVDGGKIEKVFEENYWINHVNTSPGLPNILTFCHEGPWHQVDHRIWGMDHSTGKVWKIRERKNPDESIGHEYWYADGKRIGYHGEIQGEGKKFFGRVNWDNSDNHEVGFPFSTGHIHSNDEHIVVGDGYASTPHVRIWRYDAKTGSYEGPRAVCIHRSSMHSQILHVHPRLTPDGKQIVYTSDMTGYGSPYLVDVPNFDALLVIDAGEGGSRV